MSQSYKKQIFFSKRKRILQNENKSLDPNTVNEYDNIQNISQETSTTTNNDISSFGLIKRGLRVGNLNVCHVIPKFDEINLLLKGPQTLDILGLCETFLDDQVDSNLLQIDGFSFERKDRDGKSGGGLLLYISNSINYKRRPDLEVGNNIESIWTEIAYQNSKPILVCTAYRPPSAPRSWITEFAREIDRASSCDNELLILGNFNICHLKEVPRYWTHALEEFDLSQVILTPTRVTDKTNTLIDLVYTNKPQNICEVKVPVIALSDHYPVCVTRSISKNTTKKKHIEIKYRDFNNFDENDFLRDLTNNDFNSLELLNDPNEILKLFYENILSVLSNHAKTKTKRVKGQLKPKWLSKEINEARHKRDLFHKRLDMENYRTWRNKVTQLIREAKTKYYKDAIEENHKIGDIWKCLKELNPRIHHSAPNLLKSNGETSTETNDITNTFNNFFLNLSKHLSSHDIDASRTLEITSQYARSKLPDNQQFKIDMIKEHQVFLMLRKLNVSKSSGIDSLGPRILKLAAPVIAKPIAHLINKSIEEGIFPNDLKIAKITPIFKKGERSDPGNYRPISILPTLSKIIEKHIASQLRTFLQNFDLLQKEQSGFREHHSCQTALTKLTDMWLKDIDNGNFTGTSFVDFTKAFDLVDHKLLIQKLECYKFNENTLKWFISYLSNRKQSVHIGDTQSDYLEIISGVPQGSVLGPLLFLIYINDLPLHVKHSNIDIFADDATLHSSAPDLNTIQVALCKDLENINIWCLENKMKINEKKTKCMLIGTNQKL